MATWNLFEAILGSVVGGEESEVLGDKYERARNDTFAVAKHEVAFRRHFDGFMAKGMSIGVWKHSREGGVVPSLKTFCLVSEICFSCASLKLFWNDLQCWMFVQCETACCLSELIHLFICSLINASLQ